MKKKILIVFLIILLAAAAGTAVWYFKFREEGESTVSEEMAFVDSVASIMGIGSNGTVSRFSGVIEPQKTVGVEVASGLKVKDTFVTVGQEVKVGTRLFSYDTDEAQDSITQLEIDIENYEIEIESTKATIAQYEKERAKVSDSEKRAYTTSIMTAENSIRRAEYNIKSKQAELESLKKQVANAYVTSELQGVVKTINKNNSGSSDGGDMIGMSDGSTDENSNAYITIMATGEYRVKGTVNEQNIQQLQEGMSVLVHSRVDESIIWHGTVSTIDMENAQQTQNNYGYGSSDGSMSNSSSYPFYVELEESTGLMLGQHVYVEPDYGQSEEREGLWLYEYYLIMDENGEVTPYVWAATEKDRLEKREVTLGEYDSELGEYQILDGLTTDDYIAYPTDDLQEGQSVTRNAMMDTGSADMGDMMDLLDGASSDEGDGYIDDSQMMGDMPEIIDDGSGMIDDGSGMIDDGSGMMDDGSGMIDDGSGMMDDGSGMMDGSAWIEEE